jgi:hypothetical protein
MPDFNLGPIQISIGKKKRGAGIQGYFTALNDQITSEKKDEKEKNSQHKRNEKLINDDFKNYLPNKELVDLVNKLKPLVKKLADIFANELKSEYYNDFYREWKKLLRVQVDAPTHKVDVSFESPVDKSISFKQSIRYPNIQLNQGEYPHSVESEIQLFDKALESGAVINISFSVLFKIKAKFTINEYGTKSTSYSDKSETLSFSLDIMICKQDDQFIIKCSKYFSTLSTKTFVGLDAFLAAFSDVVRNGSVDSLFEEREA